jgi:serine/threonine protein kinase
MHGWYEDENCIFLAMEYFPHGDLEGYISQGITEAGAKIICMQLLEGLSLMHRLGFTHRDLKPQVGII